MARFTQGRALVVGVGKYQHVAEVAATAHDAEDVAATLADETVAAYPPDQVQLLRNEETTLALVDTALQNLAQQAQPGDTVIVFLCGHGAPGTDGEYYFGTHDAVFVGNQIQAGTGLSTPTLLQRLRVIPAQKVLLILNTCFSGYVQPSLAPAAPAPMLPVGAPPPTELDHAVLNLGAGRALITASRPSQYSYFLATGRNTFFGTALIQALRGATIRTTSPYIDLADLYKAIHASVTTAAQAHQLVQEPMHSILQGVGPFPVAHYLGARVASLGSETASSAPTLLGTPPRVYLSHHATEPAARVILEKITLRLQAAGIKVLTHENRLAAQPTWDRDLFNAMGLAHAAILLLSPNALASPLAQKEARFLTGRLALSEPVTLADDPFKLLPIQIGDVAAGLRQGPWPHMAWALTPALADPDPDQIAARVMQQLAWLAHAQAQPMPTNLEALLATIAKHLTPAHDVFSRVAHALQATNPAAAQSNHALARALWQSDCAQWNGVMQELTPLLDDRRAFMRLISPTWVDPCAAGEVLEATRRDAPKRVILTDATLLEFTPDNFVRRAYCRPPNASPILISMASLLSGKPLAESYTELREKLIAKLFAQRPPEKLLELRLHKAIAKQPIFVGVAAPHPDRKRLAAFLDLVPFPNLYFFVLTEDLKHATAELGDLRDTVTELPSVDPELEFEACDQYESILKNANP